MAKKEIKRQYEKSRLVTQVQSKMNTEIVDILTFKPNKPQRAAKAIFQLNYEQNPFFDISNISLPMLAKMAKTEQVKIWWSQDGFQQWFFNKAEFAEKVEAATYKALDICIEILGDEDAKASERLKAAGMVLDIGGKAGAKRIEVRLKDEKINSITDHRELDKLIRTLTIEPNLLETKPVIDIKPEED